MEAEMLQEWQETWGNYPDEVYEELADGGYLPDGVQFIGEGGSLEDVIGDAIEEGLLGEEIQALATVQ